MNLSTQQEARVTSTVNAFGDWFAQDRSDLHCHQVCAIIRKEMAEETVPLGHPDLRDELDWIDSILDKIDARRKSTVGHVAMNMRRSLASHLH
jgi:hypothetical protein